MGVFPSAMKAGKLLKESKKINIMKTADFVDAQLMHKEHPKTFEVPSKKELNALKPGDIVKVCADGERFWTKIESVKGNDITATVDNDLALSSSHGLYCGDTISFTKDNIYSIY